MIVFYSYVEHDVPLICLNYEEDSLPCHQIRVQVKINTIRRKYPEREITNNLRIASEKKNHIFHKFQFSHLLQNYYLSYEY